MRIAEDVMKSHEKPWPRQGSMPHALRLLPYPGKVTWQKIAAEAFHESDIVQCGARARMHRTVPQLI